MSAVRHQVPITLDDVEAAAKDAFDMFVAHLSRPPQWDTLSDVSKERWRRTARTLLSHVIAS